MNSSKMQESFATRVRRSIQGVYRRFRIALETGRRRESQRRSDEEEVISAPSSADSLERDKLYQERVVNRIANLVSVAFLVLLFVVYPEVKQMEITIGGLQLTLITIIVGVVLASFICFAVVRRFPFLRETSRILRLSLLFMVAVGCSASTMGAATYINRTFAQKRTFYRQVRIKEKASSSRNRYRNSSQIRLLYIAIEGKTERIQVEEAFWISVSEGSTILLELRWGFFGYAYVVGHKKIDGTERS
jgi:hypothetical protein